MPAPDLCCFGVERAFDYRHIGGTDSYFRRFALELISRGWRVRFLHYGCDSAGEEAPVPGLTITRTVTFQDSLRHLEALTGRVMVSSVRRGDRLAFAAFRRRHRSRLRFHFVASVRYESWFRHQLYFLEPLVFPYDSVIAMSPRLATAARRHLNGATTVLPPVPESYFVRCEDKPPPDPLVVTYMGRTVPGKGVDEAMAVFRQLADDPGIVTQVCGYVWPDRREDTSIHEELLHQTRIRYLHEPYGGWSPEVEDRVGVTLRGTHILLLPYRALSSTIDMPLLLLEGMAAGCVVISKNLGDMAEVYGTERFMPAADKYVEEAIELIRGCKSALAAEQERVAAQARKVGLGTRAAADRLIEALRTA